MDTANYFGMWLELRSTLKKLKNGDSSDMQMDLKTAADMILDEMINIEEETFLT